MREILKVLKSQPLELLINSTIFAVIFYIPIVFFGQPKWWHFPLFFVVGIIAISLKRIQNYIVNKE